MEINILVNIVKEDLMEKVDMNGMKVDIMKASFAKVFEKAKENG